MNRKAISFVPMGIFLIFSLTFNPSLVLSEDSLTKLEAREKRAASKLTVFSHQRADESRIVEALPVLRSAEEEAILNELKEARKCGDTDSAVALQSRLDALHGIVPNAPSEGAYEVQGQVSLEAPPQGPGIEWVEGDILITDPTFDQVRPAMASAPNGDLYVAVESMDDFWIRIYRSTDGGQSWSGFQGFASGVDTRNPSIAYAEFSDEQWIYVAYEHVSSDGTRAVRIFRVDPEDMSNNDFITVQSGITMAGPNDHIFPEICTDDLEFGAPYIYVTYPVYAIDYYPVYFSRSTDRGLTWSTPENITGGAENSSWPTRPDIAYGSSGLFVAFEKLGWTGSAWANQVWVTISDTYGSSWGTPIQLTDWTENQYHPRVAAAIEIDSVVVAYTLQYTNDNDVKFAFSIDGGSNWSSNHSLPWTFDDEESVELSVSNYQGRFHAAYWHENDIWYTSADTASPNPWTSPCQTVNELNRASHTYPRPTVAVNPTKPVASEVCIAWTDFRGLYYDAYFDSVYLGVSLRDELALDFGISGLWDYDGTNWTFISSTSPEGICGWSGGLALDFGASGVWNYDGATWTPISGSNVEDMADWANGLAIDFGASGVWNYDGATWTLISGLNPEGMAGWSGGLALDFGASGVWNYDGATWTPLSGTSPEGMEGWSGGLAVDFGASGLWNYDGTTWNFMSDSNPEDMACWPNGLAVDFGASGVWSYDGTTWTPISGSNVEGINGWASGLAVDFGLAGLWNYDGTTWTMLSGSDVEDMDDVDLY